MSVLTKDPKGTDIGSYLALLLGLEAIKSGPDKGRYKTSWGSKTALGLYLTVKRVIEDGEKGWPVDGPWTTDEILKREG